MSIWYFLGSRSKSIDEKTLNEWLRKNEYKVEVQGEIYKVKPLLLHRLNLLNLKNRQNILFTSIQIRSFKIENSMALTVANGNKDGWVIDTDFLTQKLIDLDKTDKKLQRTMKDNQRKQASEG